MFRKNPLVELELNYLRQNRPHQKRHYFLLALAFLVSITPYFHMFIRDDDEIIAPIVFVILAIYWFIQLQIMYSAMVSVNKELADEMLGSYSNRELISAKLQGILKHHRLFIVVMTFCLLGLSLVLTGFLGQEDDYFIPNAPYHMPERHFLEYVGIEGIVWDATYYSNVVESFPPFLNVFVVALGLFILVICNGVLSISFGLWAKRRANAYLGRIALAIIVTVMFLIFYYVRDALEQYYDPICPFAGMTTSCENYYPFHYLFITLNSLQAFALAYIDSGVSLTTALMCPGRNSLFYNYGWRHLYTGGVVMLSQFSLSAFLLWRTSRGIGKKKK